MKISIDRINSAAIRAEMERDSYSTAEYLGTFRHPAHPESRDWDLVLYYAADEYVFDTNGSPVWEKNEDEFHALCEEYNIDFYAAIAR